MEGNSKKSKLGFLMLGLTSLAFCNYGAAGIGLANNIGIENPTKVYYPESSHIYQDSVSHNYPYNIQQQVIAYPVNANVVDPSRIVDGASYTVLNHDRYIDNRLPIYTNPSYYRDDIAERIVDPLNTYSSGYIPASGNYYPYPKYQGKSHHESDRLISVSQAQRVIPRIENDYHDSDYYKYHRINIPTEDASSHKHLRDEDSTKYKKGSIGCVRGC